MSETASHGFSETILNSMAFSLACASVSFAAYMIIMPPNEMTLSISEAQKRFKDPLDRENAKPRDWELNLPGRADNIITGSLTEFTGYGSLKAGIGEIYIDGKEATLGRTYGYVLHEVHDGTATVETRNQLGKQLWRVKPGSLLPGAGRVISILNHDGRWRVLTTGGN